jgi:hypothetical protein
MKLVMAAGGSEVAGVGKTFANMRKARGIADAEAKARRANKRANSDSGYAVARPLPSVQQATARENKPK